MKSFHNIGNWSYGFHLIGSFTSSSVCRTPERVCFSDDNFFELYVGQDDHYKYMTRLSQS